MALGEERLCSIIESLLLISPDPVPVPRIIEVIRFEDPGTEEAAIKGAVAVLLESYADTAELSPRGFRVEHVAGGLQLRTTAENAPFVRRYLAAKPQRLSKAALETLAIVAYRQPVTKPEIEAIRGVDAGGALRSLLDRDLVKIVGKKDELGRPLLYGTTPYFLEFFTLKNLSELPTLREFHELDEASLEEVAALEGLGSVQDLAEAAQFLVQREEDPDIQALDAAVKAADAVKAAAEAALAPEDAAKEQEPSDRAGEPIVGQPNAEGGTERAAPRGPEGNEKDDAPETDPGHRESHAESAGPNEDLETDDPDGDTVAQAEVLEVEAERAKEEALETADEDPEVDMAPPEGAPREEVAEPGGAVEGDGAGPRDPVESDDGIPKDFVEGDDSGPRGSGGGDDMGLEDASRASRTEARPKDPEDDREGARPKGPSQDGGDEEPG